MKGLDLIDAVGRAENRFVEEADAMPEKKGKKSRVRMNAWMKAAACAACFLLFSVPVLAKEYRYSLWDHELAFERVEYLGDGKVVIRIWNGSDTALRLQENVKLCTFYGNQEFEQLPGGKIRMENRVVEPHSSSDVLIDLSKAYDLSQIGPLESEKDWYYLVLTDDRFLFGHDWQCAVDFEGRAEESQKISGEWGEPAPEPERQELSVSSFRFENWHAPLDTMILSGVFGEQRNGLFSEEINLAGEGGESVYAVAASRVLETGFEARKGKYVILLLEDGTEVTYAHLKEIQVQEGETKEAGETIGTLGATGMATGPNLALKVCVDGEPVDPIR